MGSKFVRVLVACAVAGAVFITPAAASTMGHVHFLGGQYKINDDKDTDPLTDLAQGGVELSIAGDNWPIMLAVDLLGATGDDSTTEKGPGGFKGDFDIKLDVSELALGVRKIWGEDSIHPFVGGGVSYVQADATFDLTLKSPLGNLHLDDDANDNVVGYWAQGGLFWRIGKRFEIGGQVRYNTAEVDAGGDKVDVGGFGYGVLLGWGWP